MKSTFYINSLRIWDKNGSVIIYLITLKVLRKYSVTLSQYTDTFPSEPRAIQWPFSPVFVLS